MKILFAATILGCAIASAPFSPMAESAPAAEPAPMMEHHHHHPHDDRSHD